VIDSFAIGTAIIPAEGAEDHVIPAPQPCSTSPDARVALLAQFWPSAAPPHLLLNLLGGASMAACAVPGSTGCRWTKFGLRAGIDGRGRWTKCRSAADRRRRGRTSCRLRAGIDGVVDGTNVCVCVPIDGVVDGRNVRSACRSTASWTGRNVSSACPARRASWTERTCLCVPGSTALSTGRTCRWSSARSELHLRTWSPTSRSNDTPAGDAAGAAHVPDAPRVHERMRDRG